MSDQPADGSLPELTPEQESAVRRLLADARHDEPIPADVGARLDAVLAGLTRDDPGNDGVAPVIDLAARRRRRNAAALLAGAAAVIVAGFGIGQVIDVSTGSSDEPSSASLDADRAESGGDTAGSGDGVGNTVKGSEQANPTEPAPAAGPEAPLQLRSDHLERDVTDQLHALESDMNAARSPDAKSFYAVGCEVSRPLSTRFGLGELFPALFDDAPAVLAVRPASGGTRQADVLDCVTADSLASVTIPAR
jgi:hypothetical protein